MDRNPRTCARVSRLFSAPLRLCASALIAVASLTALAVSPAFSQQSESSRPVAAKINGEPVFAAEAEAELALAYGDRKFTDAERKPLMRAALDQVIDRRLVIASLTKSGQAATKADIDFELSQLEKALKAQNQTLAQHCERTGQTPDDLRRSLAWKLSWKRYLEKN